MKQNLKNRLAKVNSKLAKYGFNTINEIDAINFNSISFPESAQDGGWKAIANCKPKNMLGYEVEKFFNRKDAAQIGSTLIEISKTYTGKDIY